MVRRSPITYYNLVVRRAQYSSQPVDSYLVSFEVASPPYHTLIEVPVSSLSLIKGKRRVASELLDAALRDCRNNLSQKDYRKFRPKINKEREIRRIMRLLYIS